ncbi:MAG: response regulator [Desulfobacterales bacterium]|nr:response regulator [Desulfobacterales bacterium]
MENLRVLIVEDDLFTLKLIAKKLGKEGYDLETARSGDEAAELISGEFFDVVITDLMMPGNIDGIGVLEAAKAANSRTEVLLLTGHASVDTAVEAMKKGAADYLQKPVNFYELIFRLEKISNFKNMFASADDLREAMDVTERNAARTIQDLEMTVSGLESLVNEISRVAQSEHIDAGKRLGIIRDVLSSRGDH